MYRGCRLQELFRRYHDRLKALSASVQLNESVCYKVAAGINMFASSRRVHTYVERNSYAHCRLRRIDSHMTAPYAFPSVRGTDAQCFPPQLVLLMAAC